MATCIHTPSPEKMTGVFSNDFDSQLQITLIQSYK